MESLHVSLMDILEVEQGLIRMASVTITVHDHACVPDLIQRKLS